MKTREKSQQRRRRTTTTSLTLVVVEMMLMLIMTTTMFLCFAQANDQVMSEQLQQQPMKFSHAHAHHSHQHSIHNSYNNNNNVNNNNQDHVISQQPSPSKQKSRYRTMYACEDRQLNIECDEGTRIDLIRANYGRFSISICNEHGNLDWSIDCMSPISFRIMQQKCNMRPNCSINASSLIFGDKCPKTPKYLEVHFQCQPIALTPTYNNNQIFNNNNNQQVFSSHQPTIVSTTTTTTTQRPKTAAPIATLEYMQPAAPSVDDETQLPMYQSPNSVIFPPPPPPIFTGLGPPPPPLAATPMLTTITATTTTPLSSTPSSGTLVAGLILALIALSVVLAVATYARRQVRQEQRVAAATGSVAYAHSTYGPGYYYHDYHNHHHQQQITNEPSTNGPLFVNSPINANGTHINCPQQMLSKNCLSNKCQDNHSIIYNISSSASAQQQHPNSNGNFSAFNVQRIMRNVWRHLTSSIGHGHNGTHHTYSASGSAYERRPAPIHHHHLYNQQQQPHQVVTHTKLSSDGTPLSSVWSSVLTSADAHTPTQSIYGPYGVNGSTPVNNNKSTSDCLVKLLSPLTSSSGTSNTLHQHMIARQQQQQQQRQFHTLIGGARGGAHRPGGAQQQHVLQHNEHIYECIDDEAARYLVRHLSGATTVQQSNDQQQRRHFALPAIVRDNQSTTANTTPVVGGNASDHNNSSPQQQQQQQQQQWQHNVMSIYAGDPTNAPAKGATDC